MASGKRRGCGVCGEVKGLQVCSACKGAWFCSKSHAKIGWNSFHRSECALLAARVPVGDGWAPAFQEIMSVILNRRADRLPDLSAVRDALNLAATCRTAWNASRSPAIWSNVDVGKFLKHAPTEKVIRSGHLRLCSVLRFRKGATSEAEMTQLIKSLPRLKLLSLTINGSPSTPSILKAIEALESLESLELKITETVPSTAIVCKLPASLKVLEVMSNSDLSRLWSSPLPFLEQVILRDCEASDVIAGRGAIAERRLRSMARVTPNVLLLNDLRRRMNVLRQGDVDAVLDSCHALRALALRPAIGEFARRQPGITLARLETAKCSSSLELVNLSFVPLARGSVSVLSSSCPNLQVLVLTDVEISSESDLRAIAELKNLRVLDLGPIDLSPNEISRCFAAIGASPGAIPLGTIHIGMVGADMTEFFRSPRCHEIEELGLRFTTKSPAVASEGFWGLAANCRDSLSKLRLCGSIQESCVIPLFAGCTNLQWVEIVPAPGCSNAISAIGKHCRSSPVEFHIMDFHCMMTDSLLFDLIPALKGARVLVLSSPSLTIDGVARFLPEIPFLHAVSVPEKLANALRPVAPPWLAVVPFF